MEEVFRKNVYEAVGKGFLSGINEINNMINDGKSLKDIQDYCLLIIDAQSKELLYKEDKEKR